MNELSLSLTVQEREFLVNTLQTALKDTLVEEHRTRTPSFREHIVHNEELLEGLLKKLGQTAA